MCTKEREGRGREGWREGGPRPRVIALPFLSADTRIKAIGSNNQGCMLGEFRFRMRDCRLFGTLQCGVV